MSRRKDLIVQELSRIDGRAPGKNNALGKHLKMSANPFRFFRGSAQLFYADLASGKLAVPKRLISDVPLTTVMGDCHLSNFGFFTEEGAHGDAVIFAPNDFDDACMGIAAWDLLRFGVSLCLATEYGQGIVAGHYLSDELDDPKGFVAASMDDSVAGVDRFLSAYKETCISIADNPEQRRTALAGFDKGHILARLEAKACDRASGGRKFLKKSALAKAIDYTGSNLKFKERPERFRRLSKKRYRELADAFRPYVDDHILDIVERLGAGTGSVNMARYYLLVGPKPGKGPNDYKSTDNLHLCHLVEIKQQREAAPIYYFVDISPNNRLNPAHLTVDCQRRMQRRPDVVLDDGIWKGKHWLVRSRHHARVGIDPEDVVLVDKAKTSGKKQMQTGILDYAAACGNALALAHARGDRRSMRFEKAMVKALEESQHELVEECVAYQEVVVRDWKLMASLLG